MQEELDNFDLDEIYSSEETGESGNTEQEVQQPEPVIQQEQETDTGVKEEASPPEVDEEAIQQPQFQSDQEKAAFAALKDERSKRQELERRLELIEQNQQPQQGEVDYYEDPEAAMNRQQQQVNKALFDTRVEMSQEIYRAQHEDYDEVEAVFAEAAQQDPVLAHGLMQARVPAKFAYEQGKRLMFIQEIGDDPEAYKERIAKEAVEKFQLEQKAKGEQHKLDNALSAQPTSLASVASESRRTVENEADDFSLSDIYKD